MLNVDVIRFRDLSSQLLTRWEELHGQAAAPCDSPYYRPEYCAAIDAVRGDLEVGVVEQNGAVAALLPFHRRRGIGQPAGLHLNDFQGLIGGAGLDLPVATIVRGCRLAAYDFDHVPVAQAGFAKFTGLIDESPVIDLSQGFDHYERTTLRPHADYSSLLRRNRKLERDLGKLQIDLASRDTTVFDTLIQWKREQFAASGVPDALAPEWVLPVLQEFLAIQQPRFQGMLNVLYAGDRIVGIDMGLRCGDVYHSAWCAYDQQLRSYAPGRQMYLRLHRALADEGIRRIEWGKGENAYKSRTMTGASMVASGSVACSTVQRVMRGGWWRLRKWVRHSPLRPHVKVAAAYLGRLRRNPPALAKEGA